MPAESAMPPDVQPQPSLDDATIAFAGRCFDLARGGHTAELEDLETLIHPRVQAARTRFIAQRQQWQKAGDPWDGAYIAFDNDAGVPARWERSSDRNEAWTWANTWWRRTT